jgi:hypothetical protein
MSTRHTTSACFYFAYIVLYRHLCLLDKLTDFLPDLFKFTIITALLQLYLLLSVPLCLILFALMSFALCSLAFCVHHLPTCFVLL